MKKVFIAAVAVLALCAGCSPKLGETEVSTVLAENVPAKLKSLVTLEKPQTEISSNGDDTAVKFKTQLKLSQPLFEELGFDAMAKAANGETSLFTQIEEAARGLTPADRESLADAIQKATFKPVFIAQKAPAGATGEWYGSFKSKKVIDKWVSSDFLTDVAPIFEGRPRSEFHEAAIESGGASAWFAEAKTRQVDLLQKMDTMKKLAQKDGEIAQAKAAAATEREAKEALAAAQEKQSRQMPVNLSIRKALLGGTSVLVVQATQTMSVHLEVERDLQKFSRDYQLAPGRPVQIGHLEGWGFKPGDTIRVTNSSFDPKEVTVQ